MATRRGVLVVTALLAVATFACVQDRVTAAAARRYVAEHRAASAASPAAERIEDVMAPAVRSSVHWGALGSAIVAAVGLGVSARCRR